MGSQEESRSLASSTPSVPFVLLADVWFDFYFSSIDMRRGALFACVSFSYNTIRCDKKTRNENISTQMKHCDVCKETKWCDLMKVTTSKQRSVWYPMGMWCHTGCTISPWYTRDETLGGGPSRYDTIRCFKRKREIGEWLRMLIQTTRYSENQYCLVTTTRNEQRSVWQFREVVRCISSTFAPGCADNVFGVVLRRPYLRILVHTSCVDIWNDWDASPSCGSAYRAFPCSRKATNKGISLSMWIVWYFAIRHPSTPSRHSLYKNNQL